MDEKILLLILGLSRIVTRKCRSATTAKLVSQPALFHYAPEKPRSVHPSISLGEITPTTVRPKGKGMKVMMIVRRVHTPLKTCARRLGRPVPVVFVAGGSLSLSGCGGAPSLTIAGAYFPAWLLCSLITVLVAVVVRVLMVVTGLSNHLPYQLAVCASIGVIVALVVWQLWMVH